MVAPPETKHLKLEVSNFGPIAEASVELRPMTVFVGPSNTGKSYLATLIYALHQFFGAYSGLEIVEGATTSSFFRRPRMMIPVFEMELSVDDVDILASWAENERLRVESTHGSSASSSESNLPVEISNMVRLALSSVASLSSYFDEEISRCFGVVKSDSLVRYSDNDEMAHSVFGTISNELDDGSAYKYEIGATTEGANIKAFVPYSGLVRLAKSLHTSWFRLDPFDSGDLRERRARAHLAVLTGVAMAHSVGSIGQPAHYLTADRAGVMHTHRALVLSLVSNASRALARDESSLPTFSGVYGDFLEKLVALSSPTGGAGSSDHPVALGIERDVLHGTIRVENNPVGFPLFLYRPDGWNRDIPLMNVSSMVSELAPVVLYLRHVVQPGDTLIIEEPESHLHPGAQVEFTRLLAAAVKAGIRIIITTHSEWVLEELANLVRMSELSPERREGLEAADFALTTDEVGAWFFDPGGEDGGSVVREIPLDVDSGTFPSGFGLVTADLYNRWVEITSRVENG